MSVEHPPQVALPIYRRLVPLMLFCPLKFVVFCFPGGIFLFFLPTILTPFPFVQSLSFRVSPSILSPNDDDQVDG